EIMALADAANEFIAAQEPWKLAKQAGAEAQTQAVCTLGINLFRAILTYLKPVVPALTAAAEEFLGETLSWTAPVSFRAGEKINEFKPLLTRVEKDKVDAMIEAGKESQAAAKASAAPAGSAKTESAQEPIAAEIEFNDF